MVPHASVWGVRPVLPVRAWSPLVAAWVLLRAVGVAVVTQLRLGAAGATERDGAAPVRHLVGVG